MEVKLSAPELEALILQVIEERGYKKIIYCENCIWSESVGGQKKACFQTQSPYYKMIVGADDFCPYMEGVLDE